MNTNLFRRTIIVLLVFFLGIILWQLIYTAGVFSRLILPSPIQVVQAFILWGQTDLWEDLLDTLIRLFSSVSFGIVAGLIIGVVMAAIPIFRDFAAPLIESIRSIPAIALFPLFTAAFGIGEASRIASATFSVLFLVALYTFQGIATVNKSLLLVPQTIAKDSTRIRFWVYKEIYFLGALPTILFGLRLSLPIVLVVIVATEMMFGTSHGLGSRIIISQLAYRIPPAWAAIILTGLLGYGLNVVLKLIEEKYSFWVGR
jgi:ABC-type nitrate/sulfonate/bicarbonate transport system permease component